MDPGLPPAISFTEMAAPGDDQGGPYSSTLSDATAGGATQQQQKGRGRFSGRQRFSPGAAEAAAESAANEGPVASSESASGSGAGGMPPVDTGDLGPQSSLRPPPESVSISGGLDKATEELVAAANEALELAMRYRGAFQTTPSPASAASARGVQPGPSPLVFSGCHVFKSGCTGLTLMPAALSESPRGEAAAAAGSPGIADAAEVNAGGRRLPAVAAAFLSRAMLGHDRFSMLDLQV